MNNKSENLLLDMLSGWVPTRPTQTLMAWETWADQVDPSIKAALTVELWSYEREVARLRAKPPLEKRP